MSSLKPWRRGQTPTLQPPQARQQLSPGDLPALGLSLVSSLALAWAPLSLLLLTLPLAGVALAPVWGLALVLAPQARWKVRPVRRQLALPLVLVGMAAREACRRH